MATGTLKTVKNIQGDWTCLTLDCGIKICYSGKYYGNVGITNTEGSLYWATFSKSLPSNFFTQYPCVHCQCEVASGWATYLVLNPSSSTSVLNGWFYTDKSVTVNPYVHIFCIGV